MSTSTKRRHVHPFPARMAPDVALEKITELRSANARVLDPMCGSGTVVRLAAEAGHRAIGADLDPMAVFLTRTASIKAWTAGLRDRAAAVVDEARQLDAERPPWIANDEDTMKFVDYWFASDQADDLSRLARTLAKRPRRDDPLRVALSRLIVTKDGGASLARDTSHSRPHRTRDQNGFDVLAGFIESAATIESRIGDEVTKHRPHVRRADARALGFVQPKSVDLVVTSPPYLNAIDYLRGHRMSLVWLGWTTPVLRGLRAETVGAERGLKSPSTKISDLAVEGSPRSTGMAARQQNLVYRFTKDAHDFSRALARVVKPSGTLVFVVADSQLRGVPISNSGICAAAAKHHGFRLVKTETREIPASHRYLPPPGSATSSLSKRMKEEVIFTFRSPS